MPDDAKETTNASEPLRPAGAPVRQANGQLVGGNPRNRGGQKGRSGRPPNVFRQQLAALRDGAGLRFLKQVVNGEVRYVFKGICEHCGKESRGVSPAAAVKLAPSPDTRVRAVAEVLRHTLPKQQVEGISWEDALSLVEKLALIIREEIPPEHYTPRLAERLAAAARTHNPVAA